MNVNQNDIGRRLASATHSVVRVLAAQVGLLALVGWFAFSRHGTGGIMTAGVAAMICFLPAAAALYLIALTTGTPNALSGTLASMILRTALPFFVTIFMVQAFKPLADMGLFGMVLINYLVVIAVESALAVRLIQTLAPSAVRP